MFARVLYGLAGSPLLGCLLGRLIAQILVLWHTQDKCLPIVYVLNSMGPLTFIDQDFSEWESV